MQRDLLLLGEMTGAAERASELVTGITVQALQADRLHGESLLWNFTVLGEAATQLSDDITERFPAIPWQQPARLRNRIVHGYWSIDLDILHTTATDQLPTFARDFRQILDTLTAGEHTATALTPDAAAPAPEQPQDPARSDGEG